MAIGPGLTTNPEGGGLLEWLLSRIDFPAVVDADALNLVAGNPDIVREAKSDVVLTPHPGEMSRLRSMSVTDIQADRPASAGALARALNSTTILKGAGTIVACPDGRIHVNLTGNPGMGKGGMGDALTGLIGGLMAQGLRVEDASRAGVFIHGRAGDHASRRGSQHTLTTSDLIEHLPCTFRDLSAR